MSVELLRSMGDDLSIVNAARVSYAKESTWLELGNDEVGHWTSLRASDTGLIRYLMQNRHGTPFEMVQFQFRVVCSIAVAREWQRHRIGSFNEVSTRYVEMAADFYVPQADALRSQVGKPGHYEMVPLAGPAYAAGDVIGLFEQAYADAFRSYRLLLDRGVAKELARNVLPLGLMTQFVWSVNLRSLLNFLSLRNAPDALLEIRLEAAEVETHARRVVPTAMAAWDANDRVAP